MTHERIEGLPIGQHPLVTRLMKGVYNLRPPRPRYSHTWDVDLVVQHIGENSDLTLKRLSRKLAFLMALVVASRTSEPQALDLRFRAYRPNGVLFQLREVTKTQKTGSPPKERFFGSFPYRRLCVVHCLKQYEEATHTHRDPESEFQPLFLSYVKPFKPVRIAHWVKDMLSEGGVDTRVFKAHSVRGASVSAAKITWQTGAKFPPSEGFTIVRRNPINMLRVSSGVQMGSELDCILDGSKVSYIHTCALAQAVHTLY